MPEAALGRAPGTPAASPSSGGGALPATGIDHVLQRYENIIKSPEDKRVYRYNLFLLSWFRRLFILIAYKFAFLCL